MISFSFFTEPLAPLTYAHCFKQWHIFTWGQANSQQCLDVYNSPAILHPLENWNWHKMSLMNGLGRQVKNIFLTILPLCSNSPPMKSRDIFLTCMSISWAYCLANSWLPLSCQSQEDLRKIRESSSVTIRALADTSGC